MVEAGWLGLDFTPETSTKLQSTGLLWSMFRSSHELVKVIPYINQTLGRTQAKLAVNFANSITGSYMDIYKAWNAEKKKHTGYLIVNLELKMPIWYLSH
jgi:hypothetical protein